MKDRQTRPAEPGQQARPTGQGREYITSGIKRDMAPFVVDKEGLKRVGEIERRRVGGC